MQYLRQVKKYLRPNQIPIIKLDGIINETMFELVSRSVERLTYNRISALCLVVNCPGGSLPQSYLIVSKLRSLCDKLEIPFYTFGEDIAASSGYFILSSGTHVYADQSTQISCTIQHQYQDLYIDESKQKLKFDSNSFTHYSQVQDYNHILQEKDIGKKLPEINRNHNNYFIEHILKMRGSKLQYDNNQNVNENEQKQEKERQKLKQNNEKNNEKTVQNPNQQKFLSDLYSKERIIMGEEALNLGLIDGIGNYEQILTKQFPDCNLDYISFEVTSEIIKKDYY
ncbi:hypothetical protein PPERSA_11141 [Pseudocohnilembus persalinus]|uniref:Peptidase S49 domain-containing protein n=1 Tax=Pseudocohnilembus persalinus TaxID=266149 RepID=A0A0V0R0B2_PSEPJ|nr:hypothetical protein PPERSA_11141 [Pseudocohnilembus persalinus]|eukprot:KRX07592.1 hypothetical protein PPERSA_11141 [Pseudocohnilembus persalinus]